MSPEDQAWFDASGRALGWLWRRSWPMRGPFSRMAFHAYAKVLSAHRWAWVRGMRLGARGVDAKPT